MATIEEIELRALEIRQAEARALASVAAHMREAIIDLPVESRLGLTFAKYARTLESAARASNPALAGKNELWALQHDLADALDKHHPVVVAQDALREAAEFLGEPLSRSLERVVTILGGFA